MNKWGNKSLRVRATLDPRLKQIMDDMLQYVDLSLISGYRTKAEQEELFRDGKSKLQWPQSKHNQHPSLAVDFQPHPYPVNEKELWGALGFMAGMSIILAEKYGVKIRWGGDWDMDGDLTNNDFDDLFHLEIVE